MKQFVFKWVRLLATGMLVFSASIISGCFQDGTSIFDNPQVTAQVAAVATSTGSGSGAIGICIVNDVTCVLVPGGPLNPTAAKLLHLPNAGPVVGALVTAVSSAVINTSLPKVDGTSLDIAHDIGMAFSFTSSTVSIIRLSTLTEIATYNSGTINTISFSGTPSGTVITGAVMDPARQWMILSTGDGYDIVDYSTPTAPVRVRIIASTATAVAPVVGAKMMENFGYDSAMPNGGAPFPALTAGGRGGAPIEIVDASTGKVYVPDAATQALMATQVNYIDSAAVDTIYHVILLAEEFSSQQHLIDLSQVTLNTTNNTYHFPASAYLALNAAAGNSLGRDMDNIVIESNHHLIFAGKGFVSNPISLAQLNNPAGAGGLGLASMITNFAMPTALDNLGASVAWFGPRDPHAAGAYITSPNHPTIPNTSIALWLNSAGDHLAVIDIQGVLSGVGGGGVYDPTTTVPQDIGYVAIP